MLITSYIYIYIYLYIYVYIYIYIYKYIVVNKVVDNETVWLIVWAKWRPLLLRYEKKKKT